MVIDVSHVSPYSVNRCHGFASFVPFKSIIFVLQEDRFSYKLRMNISVKLPNICTYALPSIILARHPYEMMRWEQHQFSCGKLTLEEYAPVIKVVFYITISLCS
jgi:hypothetical protein